MKKPTFIPAIISVFIFSTLAFAVNSNQDGNTKNIADNLVSNLCSDVNLTDSQKLVVVKNAKEYELKLQNISQESNKKLKSEIMNHAILEYRTVIDSVLTQEQKEVQKTKRIQRYETVLSNNN